MSASTLTSVDDRGRAAAHAPRAARGRSRHLLLLTIPAILTLVVFFVGPLLLNLQQSLKGAGGAFPVVAHYVKFFTDGYYLMVLAHTVLFGIGVTLICLVFGYPLAWALVEASPGWKAVLLFVTVAPLLTNVVVRSYGWMIVLGGTGLVNSTLAAFGFGPLEIMYTWTAVTLAMSHVLLPFMVLSLAAVLETRDRALDEAAATLGANPRQVFREVALPLSLQGIITGSLLVFSLAVGSFVTVLLLGKTSTMVLAVLIYQQLSVVSNWAFGATMGILLLLIVAFAIWLQARLVRREA